MAVISQPESKLNRCWAGWAGKTLTQAELNEVTAAHARFVRHMPNGARAQLGSANLLGLDLARRLLKEADFSGADLTGSSFAGADLERANLFSTILCDCDLNSANLRNADLRGVSLRGANLSYSVLDGADLRAAFMFKVGGAGGYARVIPATKGNADGGVDFSNCSLKGTSMNEVNLKGAIFRNALLQGVTFKRAKLDHVCLDGAILTQMNLEDLPFSAEALKTCLLDPNAEAIRRAPELIENLRRHELWYATSGQDGAPANFDGVDFQPLGNIFSGRKITAFVARQVVAAGVDFTNCQLQGAHFDGSDLRDAGFEGADLRGASFRGAKLAHARFHGADLRPLALTNGDTKAVDLTDAEYAEGQFAGAIQA